MLHPVTYIVLVAAGVASAWLAVYVYWYLPRVMERQYRESMKAFSTAIELRFPSHRGLSERVGLLSRTVGLEMGLNRKRLINLEMAATLRDIGLCSVPYALINEQTGRAWTAEEAHAYARHGEVSGAMLELVPHLRYLAPIVRNHHIDFASDEPVSGVLRSQIPLESYILNAVSAYVWSERLQGALLAREALSSQAGTTFEPEVVAALLRVLPSQRVGSTEPAEYARS